MINIIYNVLVIDGEKCYYKTMNELRLSEIKVNNVFNLVPVKFYKSLVEDGHIEDEVSYNLVYTGELEGKNFAIAWSNDLINRWDIVTKIQKECVREHLNPDDEHKFYLFVRELIRKHEDKIMELRK